MRCSLCILAALVALAIAQTTTITRGKGLGKGRSRWGKMTVDQIDTFKKSLRHTNIEHFHSALEKMRALAADRIRPSEKDEKKAEEMIKKMKVHRQAAPMNKLGDGIEEVNENIGVAENLYQGDLALSDAQIDKILADYVNDTDATNTDGSEKTGERQKRQAYRDYWYPSTTWGRTFYYYFDPSLSAAAKLVANLAIVLWHSNTCINFVRSETAPNRVRFFRGSGCYSSLGQVGGVQDISLGDGCERVGTAAHEIGHALGFFHEQSRHDRDNYITVMLSNIRDGWAGQFNKQTTDTNYNYGMPYDYGSIMQYGGISASGNSQPTMIARLPQYQDTMGSDIVSFYDISMMNEHYQCKAICTTGATCYNGGFRNSRNCSACICPSGWAGTQCNIRPPGCGATLIATAALQTFTQDIGDGVAAVRNLFVTCHWIIGAPIGSKVELTINSILNPQCFKGCMFGGLEVKAMSDHRYTGIRHCCADDIGTKIVSENHLMPVIAFNRYLKQVYSISYRAVPATTASTVTTSQVADTSATSG